MTLSKSKLARLKKDAEQADIRKRFLDRNFEAMKFCNQHGYTVYAASQYHNSFIVKLFKQHGERFEPLNDKEYDQSNIDDVMAYHADIDKEYERMYNLKFKQNAEEKKS